MKLDYLREFTVAARSAELQKAADELGISLSSLSKHMKSLEQELGVPLFVRARHTTLSRYGRIMLPYAKELTALQDEYIADFSGERSFSSGEIRLGISTIQFKERTGRFIEDFMLTTPSTKISTIEAGNSELCRLVKERKCDMAFVRSSTLLQRDPELVYYPFCVDRLVAFMHPDHPLAKAESVNFYHLVGEKILLRSENSTIYRICMAECEKLGIKLDITCAGSFAIHEMVRRGEGITLYLAKPVASDADPQIAIVPISPEIYSNVDLVFRRDGMTDSCETFFRFLQSHFLSTNISPAARP